MKTGCQPSRLRDPHQSVAMQKKLKKLQKSFLKRVLRSISNWMIRRSFPRSGRFSRHLVPNVGLTRRAEHLIMQAEKKLGISDADGLFLRHLKAQLNVVNDALERIFKLRLIAGGDVRFKTCVAVACDGVELRCVALVIVANDVGRHPCRA